MSDLLKRLQGGGLPPMPPRGGGFDKPRRFGRQKPDYSPAKWDTVFDRMSDVSLSKGNVFRVYESGDDGPVCLFLHGGGFSALSWGAVSKCVTNQVKCRCIAMDLRGHGDSVTKDETDFTMDVLANDVAKVIIKVCGEDPPPIILVGHSMGGALAVHIAYKQLITNLIGLTVIDVVEGTAMDALGAMHTYLRSRPNDFKSLEHAIEWSVRSGHVRNTESAKVSMPGQLKRIDNGHCATIDVDKKVASVDSGSGQVRPGPLRTTKEDVDAIAEEGGGTGPGPANNPPPNQFKGPKEDSKYTWRIDLYKTSDFWKGWFDGLSSKFLASSPPKLLLLAGVDRLDKEMTVAQMQGKFQMQVLPQVGHAVHEDSPDRVADILSSFMVRHKVAEPTGNYNRVFPSC